VRAGEIDTEFWSLVRAGGDMAHRIEESSQEAFEGHLRCQDDDFLYYIAYDMQTVAVFHFHEGKVLDERIYVDHQYAVDELFS
jgi:hypothetical protein